MKKRKGSLFGGLIILTAAALFVACKSSPVANWGKDKNPKRDIAAEMDIEQPWAYDPGPDPSTPMGRELIDLVATQPYMPGISYTVSGSQMFRPAFGPTLWRMIQKPNSMKILFIGQDGTHIAEAAGRTATAGFGGRAQDLAAYFGVNNSASFMNTFAYTMKGQYATAMAPVIYGNGQSLSFQSVIDNGTWLMAQDPDSPMVKWRNALIDWIIRNNKDSLKMIVLFGGPAKDSISTFIESKGGIVGTRTATESIKDMGIQVPNVKMTNAGGNAEWAVLLNKEGKDIAEVLLGRKLDYSLPADQQAQMKVLKEKLPAIYPDLQIMKGGLHGSGLIDAAQLGGYDLNKVVINGKKTISLKGLPLSDGSRITNQVLVVDLPHPTYLTNVEMENEKALKKDKNFKPKDTAATLVAKGVEDLIPYANATTDAWSIDPDPGMVNKFAAYAKQKKGNEYAYKRTDLGPAYYDFGTPKNRMVSKSDAVRMTGTRSNVIILGSRERAPFDNGELDAATKVAQPDDVSIDEMFLARPRGKTDRYAFDRGPGLEMARIMTENLPMAEISKVKPGMPSTGEAPDSFLVKTHPVKVGDFGHYRGTFQNPKVVILADPAGVDDMLTSRALTGARGQYLHGLMQDMKVGDDYLVIKTVPFGMDGASESDWNGLLSLTDRYRSEIFKAIFRNGHPDVVIADGPYASREIAKLVAGAGVPVVSIQRQGSDNNSGIAEAAAAIKANIPGQSGLNFRGKMASLPRSHMGFFSRVWEGTSGTHVLLSTDPMFRDEAFAVVAPEWAFKQKPAQSQKEIDGVNTLLKKLDDNQILRPNEPYPDYLQRLHINDVRDFWNQTDFAA